MKIKEGFVLHQLGEEYMAVAVGEAAESFNSMIRINETGAFIWHLLEKGVEKEDLVRELCENFEKASEDTVRKDVEEFLAVIKPVLEE